MALRLVNGENMCSGRLEVFHNGSWATVCDDGWDMTDATVVCRHLGCGQPVSAKINAFFGEGTGDILLDNVACRGDESSLEQCSHAGLGMHDCYHKEDAGVICEVPLKLTTPEATVSPTPEPADITTFPTESTTAEIAVMNSSTLSDSPTPEAAAVTAYRQKPDPAPINPENLTYLPKYMRVMLLRFLTGLCQPRRPGMQSIKLQGCVRDPTCRSYLSPGKRIVQFNFRGPTYPRVCLQCKVLACNRYSYPSQRYQGYMMRGKRSARDDDVIIIIVSK
ncbi:deleted in malignant brain tumors 1 protein-like [Grus americana]|uniref:deleted in malignant brain tumors 1 protein-like n=1 Tax=Grus americana TaxID=9117 RepID=UPI0024087825|nr:deleted in malignant brain tumors 1 protein-like [Grus americana]